jgi:hypothetical protein
MASREEQRWQSLSFTQKVTDFTARHQYGVILGGWAATMAISFGIIARNKYQTMPQKVCFVLHLFEHYVIQLSCDTRLYKRVCGRKA